MTKIEAYMKICAAWDLYKRFCDGPVDWQAFADALETPDIKAACETQFGRDLIVAVERELRNDRV